MPHHERIDLLLAAAAVPATFTHIYHLR